MTVLNSGYYGSYYSLTFELKFNHDMDTVYLAHCYPYTYSDMTEFIKRECTFQNKDKIRRTVLCRSLAGNDVDMLIVTNFSSHPEAIAQRKAIILTARVHPGESNSSFIMNGVIEFLISEDEGAEFLRNTFVFKIIPMLNPDGVIVGNYRCSLIGQDLNRQWIGPSSKQYPENYHTKLMMRKTLESRDIFFFCDFHGHSTHRNIFMFGNNQQKQNDRLKEKIFPMLFAENNENFSFDDCNFAVQKSRESTARVVMWKEFNLINSYTLECSFCGPSRGIYSGCHFNTTLMMVMGRVFCKTLVDFAENESRARQIWADLQLRFPLNGNGNARNNDDRDANNNVS